MNNQQGQRGGRPRPRGPQGNRRGGRAPRPTQPGQAGKTKDNNNNDKNPNSNDKNPNNNKKSKPKGKPAAGVAKKAEPTGNVKFVDESYRMRIDQELEAFKASNMLEFRFPSDLNNTERRYVHEACMRMGLNSKSRGKGEGRFLTVSKKVMPVQTRDQDENLPMILPNSKLRSFMQEYFKRQPITEEERNLVLMHDSGQQVVEKYVPSSYGATSDDDDDALSKRQEESFPMQKTYGQHFKNMSAERKKLPVWHHRDTILNAIEKHQVVIICGETGCGKSTQIPQYLFEMNETNNIICTQPRRLAAVGLAERVAYEASQEVGDTVGYSVRFEKKRGSNTRLLYCTTGVLLRDMVSRKGGPINTLNKITHLVVDEVHERDMQSDMLLIMMRQLMLQKKTNVKLILMSATLQSEVFQNYFRKLNCDYVKVPGKLFPVHQVFLENILYKTNYVEKLTQQHSKIRKALDSVTQANDDNGVDNDGGAEESITCSLCNKTFQDPIEFGTHAALCGFMSAGGGGGDPTTQEKSTPQDDSMNVVWQSEWEQGDDEDDEDTEELFLLQKEREQPPPAPPTVRKSKESPDSLLDRYHYSRDLMGIGDDTMVDIDLIITVLELIDRSRDDLSVLIDDELEEEQKRMKRKGSVLIFLSGWDEIAGLMDQLDAHPRFGDRNKFAVHPLHSNISIAEQRKIFAKHNPNVRKIICSTNIAETSITIEDVVYVIDGGTSKVKRYDPHTNVSTLMSGMIAKANAIQRMGRAGRCQEGVCFKLYSQTRFENMLEQERCEMQRTSLESLCLQVLLFTKQNVFDFLKNALDPPSEIAIQNAMVTLYEIGAINMNENLTPLGIELAKLPLDPILGRMLLLSVKLGLKNEALTLCAFSSFTKDPFGIPVNDYEHRKLKAQKSKYSSDHLLKLHILAQDKTVVGTNPAVVRQVLSVKRELDRIVPKNKFNHLVSKVHENAIVEILASLSCFGKVALLRPGTKKLISGVEKNIMTHKTSTVQLKTSPKQYRWVLFEELIRNKRFSTINGCTEVTPLAIALFQGEYEIIDETVIRINGWIQFETNNQEFAVELGVIRNRLQDFTDPNAVNLMFKLLSYNY